MIFVSICVIIGAVFVDQLTKWLAVIFLQNSEPVQVIPWFIRFAYVENRGAAWGMFSDKRWVFITVSTIAIIAVLVYLFWKRPKSKLLLSALLLIVSGGIGNMIDRCFLGYVVDFLEFTFIDFPVFNVADSCVCIGAALLILYLIISTVKEYKNEKRGKLAGNNGENDDSDKSDGDSNGNPD